MTRRLPSSALERLALACDVDLHQSRDGLTHDELRDRVRHKVGIVCSATDMIDASIFAAGGDLQVVATVAVGFDNIDVVAATARGVVVTNTPDVLTAAVAEYTCGLILSVTRRIAEGDRLIRANAWKGWSLEFMLGTQLQGKQLGIVGAGRIGTAVATLAEAFGMSVVFSERVGDGRGEAESGGRSLSARTSETGSRRVSFDEMLVTSDVVSLHVPLTDATQHLIDRRTLARMKRSAFLINMSRGAVVSEAALAWALQERLIAGAALDVYEREPDVHPDLRGLDNVVLSPHIGSATREARVAMAGLAVDNVVAVLGGRPALTPVAPPAALGSV